MGYSMRPRYSPDRGLYSNLGPTEKLTPLADKHVNTLHTDGDSPALNLSK